MTPAEPFDLVVVGGGIMGVAAALRASAGGMRVALVDREGIGTGASGVNAGTLSLQIKRAGLMPYALIGHEWWRNAGAAVGFKQTGGYTLAFTEQEHAMLVERMTQRRAAGAPIEFMSAREVLAREPSLCAAIVGASWCAEDGHADSLRTGLYLRALLRDADVVVRERFAVAAVDVRGDGFRVRGPAGGIGARRILIAAGAWTAGVAAMLGVRLPIAVRTNTVTVTEPMPPALRSGVGHATGLLTLKQKSNGSFLIGGGWQGRGIPDEGRGEVVVQNWLQNLRLARFAVPSLARARILRSWTGYEPNTPDFWPLAGELPGVAGAYVLACVRGGFTIGPCIGALMGDLILGRSPALPLFDPVREMAPGATGSPAAAARAGA